MNTTSISNGNTISNGTLHSRLNANGAKKETDEMQRRKCENLISYFTTQIRHLSKELEFEKLSRDTHLAKIAKALLCFEAKLKSDQKQIRQELYEKDVQLNRLTNEVISLRGKCGLKHGENYHIDPVVQYCPNCRKEYYLLNTSDIGVQVNKRNPTCYEGICNGK